MKKGTAGAFAVAVLVLGGSLMGSPALAKCSKDCKKAIALEYKTCKAGCAKGPSGKACKAACKSEKTNDVASCKAAANPTPPGCGEASPSGAFVY